MDTVLEGLADVGGVDEKIDTLEWIFAEDFLDAPLHQAVKNGVSEMHKFAFSFKWCCALLGLRPELMREGICSSLADLQRSVDARIKTGALKPTRRNAVSKAIEFIKERTQDD